MNRRLVTLALGCVLLVLLIVSAAWASIGVASGPRSVRPGQKVAFTATGMLPFRQVSVSIQPKESAGGNCCGTGAHGRWQTDEQGSVTVSFHFPRRYYVGCWANGCTGHIRWKPGHYAQVQVCITGEETEEEIESANGCDLRNVRIRR